ncbi:MAG TPA: hypothetical protein VK776_15970, partial [Bryobacteraceae bacterium]|nr:hypothetical protein [Bryobacteraceae bacterium]
HDVPVKFKSTIKFKLPISRFFQSCDFEQLGQIACVCVFEAYVREIVSLGQSSYASLQAAFHSVAGKIEATLESAVAK